MNKLLHSEKALELLSQLRTAVQTGSARAEQLQREVSLSASKLEREFSERVGEIDEKLAVATAEIGAGFQASKEKLEARYEHRKNQLDRAHAASRKRHLQVVEGQEGRQVFEVQRELLKTERDRDAARQESENASITFQDELAVEEHALTRAEIKAKRSFRGYPHFQRLLGGSPESSAENASSDPHESLEELRLARADTEDAVGRFRFSPLPFLFSVISVWLLVLLLAVGHAATVLVLQNANGPSLTWPQAGISFAISAAVVLALYFLGGWIAKPSATNVVYQLGKARALLAACKQSAQTRYEQEQARLQAEAQTRSQHLHQRWNRAVEEGAERRTKAQVQLDEQLARTTEQNERTFQRGLQSLERNRDQEVNRLQSQATAGRQQTEQLRGTGKARLELERQTRWQALEEDLKQETQSIYQAFGSVSKSASQLFPGWNVALGSQWAPPRTFAAAAPFGQLAVDLEQLADKPAPELLRALPGPAQFTLPLLLTFPERGSILLETKDAGRDPAIRLLNNLVLRLLSIAPPGRVVFTILDPVDLGQSFAGLMHLTDHEDRLINRRIWTQPDHIEQRLAELNEHIEKVTQLYLRNEYATITEYNEQAGRIAEPYHFLIIADFPANFSDLAVRRLLSIVASGPRCGVYTFIHWDQRKPVPLDFIPDDLRKSSTGLRARGDRLFLRDKDLVGATLALESQPDSELVTAFLQKVGRHSVDSNRIEMPFSEIAPDDKALWTLETSAELRVPIGRTGATKLQYLALGKGTRQHALVAGKTGSGKSTLFHVMITNLALWCSPDQVEFYLVDFKKGVEFKRYADSHLPHARVVAIESDREFGLSVLERVDEELRRRGDLFRRLGVQDLAGYSKAGGPGPLPRTLLIIDEFQEFFVEDDRVSQGASLLLDRLVRQGRAFGIHVVLGSQTLGGAYTLARTTLGQMVVRIALQCNEADALLIMDDDNPAPRLLSRPGEAIYNDAAGAIEGNSPFQIVWLSDEERVVWLDKVQHRASEVKGRFPMPVVFEGNAPAEVRDNVLLQDLLQGERMPATTAARAWLGAPNSIKGPTEVVFQRQSGNNLLILGQRDESALAILGVSLLSLAAQHSPGTARFIVLDATPPGSAHRNFLEQLTRAIPQNMTLAGNAELLELMAQLGREFAKRNDSSNRESAESPPIYLLIHGLQRFKALRHEEDFGMSLDDSAAAPKPSQQLNQIVCEGAQLGFHVICACDTLNNANRFLSRKALSEFELRVLFQMSAADSANLIDNPKAASLGLHRALLYNSQAGSIETFRPYALPDAAWIEHVGKELARLAKGTTPAT